MSEPNRTYGYSSQVGEWLGTLDIASPPTTASVVATVRTLADALAPLHRPAHTTLSWSEVDAGGTELAYHELEEFDTPTWDAVATQIERLGANVAIESVFIALATLVAEPAGEHWLPQSAELQLSIERADTAPTGIAVRYATFIDAWLSRTYAEDYTARDNSAVATLNAPRLERMLRKLHDLLGASFQVGQSQLYPFAIGEHGFEAIRALPARR